MTTLAQIEINELQATIHALTATGKGLLAADESVTTLSKRFLALDIPCTEETRRHYREVLLTTPTLERYISGVILHEETLSQKTAAGVLFSELLSHAGIIPGIKVDKGLIPLSRTSEENTTQGLDGLSERLIAYKKQGARFAKWRAVYLISKDTPSWLSIQTNSETLARYARICQEVGIVPIVEPEVLIEGNHTLETCFHISEKVLHWLFHALYTHRVMLEGILLKPNMVTAGKSCPIQPTSEEIAKATITVLRRTVPSAVPSINFLSGGQTPEQATQNLNNMHRLTHQLPWNLSFSYARALQEPSMKAWHGKSDTIAIAQKMLLQRAELNSLAIQGKYTNSLESL